MRTALLIIDVQKGLFDPTPRPFEADQVLSRLNDLSRRARAAGVPVPHIQHETPEGDLTYGAPGWALASGLEASDTDLRLRKTTPDAFLRTELQASLERLGVQALVVGGYSSEFCVDSTVRRAAALGYPVTLAADAHTAHDKAHATGAQIRAHTNATLPELTSFGPCIRALATEAIVF